MSNNRSKQESLTYEQLAQEFPLDTITEDPSEINKILDEVENKKSDTTIEVIVVHDHVTKRNIVIILIKEFGKNVVARIFSIFCYYFAWQRFINLNAVNLSLSADYSNMIQIANVMRELLRFITQDTKIAVDAKLQDKLKSIFLMAHMAAIPATVATLIINQTYALMLGTIGRNDEISNQLRWIPSIFAFNYYLVMVLTAYNNYGNGRGHLNALLGIFVLGGVTIAGSYYGLSQFSSDLMLFVTANSAQNSVILISYLLYLSWAHGDEGLISSLGNFKEWPRQFKEGLKTIALGVQPALVTFMDIARGILTNLFMRDPIELKAFQLLQFFPNVFTGMAAIEPRIAAQCIEAWNTHKKNPVVLKQELYQILVHSAWIASLPPVALLAFYIVFTETALSFHITRSSENEEIYQLMEGTILMTGFVPLLRAWLSVFNGLITAFKKMKDPVEELTNPNTEILDSYYQVINRQSVGVICVASISAFIVGLGLDYFNDEGNKNYWGALLGVMLVLLPIQLRNAVKSINHTIHRAEANVNGSVRSQFSPKTVLVSQSWFSTFTTTSRAAATRFGNSCGEFFRSHFTYQST